MMTPFADSSIHTYKHYLERISRILERLSKEQDADKLLAVRLAPDMFDTGFNFAIAIQFAARALCPPAGLDVPEIPDKHTPQTLSHYAALVSRLIEPISIDMVVHPVTHDAGKANLQQDPAEYVVTFALPNMIFHFSMAYAGLRHGGMRIGKADFDGFHIY